MEIEIITTKKKISKSIINQMRKATVQAVISGESIGYVVNIVKDSGKSLIINYAGEYFTFPCNYKKGDVSIYRKIGKWSQSIKFKETEKMFQFREEYQMKITFSKQIYI